MSKQASNINHKKSTLETLSTQELKAMLRQLQSQHVVLEAKNQQLACHITDMREVVKCVQNESNQELNHLLKKKENLNNEISRCESALKVANSKNNTMYSEMMAFKQLNQK